MGNIINFEQPIDYYLELADRSMVERNPLRALNAIRHARRRATKAKDIEEILLCQSQIYAELDRFEQSNDVLFELIARKLALAESYFGLAENFYCLDNVELSNYYFEKVASFATEVPVGEISSFLNEPHSLLEDIEFVESSQPSGEYRIVYPYYSTEAYDAKELIKSGEIDEAIAILEKTPDNYSNYCEAMNDLTLCYIFKLEFGHALEVNNIIIAQKPNDVYALCNRLVISNHMNTVHNVEEICVSLNSNLKMSLKEKARIAMAMCEIGDHALVVKSWEAMLEEQPYNEKFMLMRAIGLFNCNRFGDALSELDTIIKINPQNTVAKYYFRYIKKHFTDSKVKHVKFKPLEYVDDIPLNEVIARFKWAVEYFSKGDISQFDDETSIESEKLEWIFNTKNVELKTMAVYSIISSDISRKHSILAHLLFSAKVEPHVKSYIIESLLYLGEKEISLIIDGRFVQEKVRRPRGFAEMHSVVCGAFNKVFSHMIYFDKDRLAKLSKITKEINNCVTDKNLEIESQDALVAIMMFKLGVGKIINDEELCALLNIKIKLFGKYKKMFKVKI